MLIGLDASGSFSPTPTLPGFESSALAAAVVPAVAHAEISEWTREHLAEWGREALGELHAVKLHPTQRREVCEMLGGRGDLHVAVVVTSDMLMRSPEAVTAHRRRQHDLAKEILQEAKTYEGKERGRRACQLLAGHKLGSSRLTDPQYVLSATVPLAVMGAVQRALCFYAGDEWRGEMGELKLVMDKETPATVRYVQETLLATIGGDERFSVTLPEHWRQPPVHPLLARALHPDGDGLAPQYLLSETEWVESHDSVAVQVADFAAWVVRRRINAPDDPDARACFEALRPVLVGEGGRCFEHFAIGSVHPEDAVVYEHLHSTEQPPEWLMRAAA